MEQAGKHKKTHGRASSRLLRLCVLGFLSCAALFTWRITDYHQAQAAYHQLSQIGGPKLTQEEPPCAVNFEELLRENPNIAGWLYCPGTEINYPVMYAEDQEYYLTHLPDGTTNRSGSLFLDHRSKQIHTDNHLVIYGHNMRDDSMFGTLDAYAQQPFYQEHPCFYFLTPDCQYQIDVCSAYYAKSDDRGLQLEDSASPEKMLEYLAKKALYRTEARVPEYQRILTLSTCAYTFQNARFVVHGRMIPVASGEIEYQP